PAGPWRAPGNRWTGPAPVCSRGRGRRPPAYRPLPRQEFPDGPRPADAEALGIVDAEGADHLQYRVVLHPFGDDGQAHDPADLRDRLHQGAVDDVLLHVAHEVAVELQELDGQVLEIAEGAQARAEIVQREMAAVLTQGAHELGRLCEIPDRRR